MKPSELSSASTLRIAELALEAGVPEGVLNVVPGLGATVGTALALHPDVNLLTFTGSTLTDPIWWFYLYWLPKFLDARYGVQLSQVMWPLIAVYLIADVGSVYGGWLSGAMIKRGRTVNRARKTVMLVMALVIVPTAFAPMASSMWVAVLIVSVAAAAHQAWSANMYTLASDMFPRSAVASVVGIGGFAGAMGGVLFQRQTGHVLDANGGHYAPIFLICGLSYLVGWCVIHRLAPQLEPVRESALYPVPEKGI